MLSSTKIIIKLSAPKRKLEGLVDNSPAKQRAVKSKVATPVTHTLENHAIYDNFRQGDLIYGLSKGPRSVLGSKLIEIGFKHVYANDLNGGTVEKVIKGQFASTNWDKDQHQHYKLLRQQTSYLTKVGGRPLRVSEMGNRTSIAYRRACKLIIKNASEKHRIHFILDGLDISQIYENNKSNYSITNSELRTAFRVYEQKASYLFFYQHNKECPPPWRTSKWQPGFEAYAATHTKAKIQRL